MLTTPLTHDEVARWLADAVPDAPEATVELHDAPAGTGFSSDTVVFDAAWRGADGPVGGSFVAGKDFTVTAYVKNPQAGQTVKLSLPDGLSFVSAQQAEQAVEVRGDYSQVSWRVHSARPGEYLLRATSGMAGVGHKVRISAGSLFR